MNEEITTQDPAVVNGKRYSLWPQFVASKEEWIGGTLGEKPDNLCEPPKGGVWYTTEITDIRFEPNGSSSAMFAVDGKDFGCASDVTVLYIDPDISGDGWLGFRGYGGHLWRIRKHTKAP